jgi:hypothetical protein
MFRRDRIRDSRALLLLVVVSDVSELLSVRIRPREHDHACLPPFATVIVPVMTTWPALVAVVLLVRIKRRGLTFSSLGLSRRTAEALLLNPPQFRRR